jgi:Replication-relaxation
MPVTPRKAVRSPATGLRARRPARLAATSDHLAILAGRLTARDRWLLRMLHEYQVLTTTQITQLAFGTTRVAALRLDVLYRHQAVDRFRPLAITGSAPLHWVLGPAGAQVLAAEDAITVTQLGYRRDRALAIAWSPRLAHDTGVNGFFTALAATARAHPDCGLDAWWPERRCAALWGDLARPDGYGRWHEPGPAGTIRAAEFFLEYDTGTEDLPRVTAKLAGYRQLAARTGITTPVLIWLPGPARETALRALLAALPAALTALVPVATATPASAATRPGGPAGPAWLPAGEAGPRRRLACLPGAWPAAAPPGSLPATPAAGLAWRPPSLHPAPPAATPGARR